MQMEEAVGRLGGAGRRRPRAGKICHSFPRFLEARMIWVTV
jgi:hypothetical protein